MKKTIFSILIITIISSVFLPKFTFAYDDTSKIKIEETGIDYDRYKEDSENGSSEVGGNGKKGYTIENGTLNSVLKGVVKFSNPIPAIVRTFFTILTIDASSDEVNQEYGSAFSIQKLVFNKISIFSINFFEDSPEDTDLMRNVKTVIAKFYYLMRDFAIVATLAILIYTGIRMAIASVAIEKAQYKQMIVNWVVGFAILMILPYIMIIIVNIGEILVGLCEKLMDMLCQGDVKKIEESILQASLDSTAKGFFLIIPTIIYWVLTFYQLKFFFMYGKRLFNTFFLVIIAPIILVQHILDKAGDNKASSFNVWFKEFLLNVLIQPIHAFIYMIFMSAAFNILQQAPILAIFFLAALSRGEKVINNLFMIRGSSTVKSLGDNVKFSDLKKIG